MYWLELGGEDDLFAALEASAAAVDVTLYGPGVATASALVPERLRQLALTRAGGGLLGRTDASVASATTLLEAASIDRSGTVAVRARNVRATAEIDSQRVERALGSVLVDRGFEVDLDDPDHTLRALFASGAIARGTGSEDADGAASADAETASPTASDADAADPLSVGASDRVTLSEGAAADDADVCVLGWIDVERTGGFGDRAPTDRPFFQPGSMAPLEARALANLAGARPGATVVDPMCGTGGLCLEAALVGARAVGVDAQAKMARGTRENLVALASDEDAEASDEASSATDGANWAVVRGDARRLPIAGDAADAVLVDVPYERQSAVAGESLADLVTGALAEARRVADRAVVVGDRSWTAAARDAGWAVECVHRRRVHRSLVRWIHVLESSAAGEARAL